MSGYLSKKLPLAPTLWLSGFGLDLNALDLVGEMSFGLLLDMECVLCLVSSAMC